MNSNKTKRVLLKVGYSCNNNCVYCHSSPHRTVDLSPSELLKRFEMAASIGADSVVLSGGEPTIRPDLVDAARWLKKHSLGLGLVSNGRMLIYENLRQRLLENGLEYVYLSMAGADPYTFNWHTKSSSFEQFIKVVPIVAHQVKNFTINFVITAKNLPTLNKIVPLFENLGLSSFRLKFSFIEPEGNALDRYDELIPSISLAGEKLIEVRGLLQQSLPSVNIVVDGFPLCAPGVTPELYEGLREDGFFAMAEAFENRFYPVDDLNMAHSDKCVTCSLAKRCKGVFKTYLERTGDHELKPVQVPVPNSFDLAEQSSSLVFDEKSCQALSGQCPPADPVRGLFLKKDSGELVRYFAGCRDFSDETVFETLHKRYQVYVFNDPAPAPTDFVRQLTKFEKSPYCASCKKKNQCGGIFLPSKENGFERLSKQLEMLLGGLTGTVLDIGCGRVPYLEFLEPNIEEGKLHYTGLEPGISTQASGKGKRFIKSSFESYVPPCEPFDHIISLRSLNHLNHPVHALAKISNMLKYGGKVILAEDVVFSLVRPGENLSKAQSNDDLSFEHKFNLDLDEICAIAEKNGFSIKAKHSCIQTRTPLWIVVLEKTF